MLPSQEQLCKRRLKDKQQKWTKVEFTLEMYLLNHRNSVATRPFFVYVRAINGFKAPEELRDDPTVQVLKHVATDVNLIGNVMGLFVVVSCLILVHTGHPLI